MARSGPPPPAAAAGRRAAPCQRLGRQVAACLAAIQGVPEDRPVTPYVEAFRALLNRLAAILADGPGAAESDLNLARRLMDALMPQPLPVVRALDVAACVARSEVVGANASLPMPVTDSHLCVFVLDATGQGLPAAVTTVGATVELARLALGGCHSPRLLLDRLNREVLAQAEGRYLRAFVADLDLDLMEMRYVNASHCEPLWLRGERIASLDTQGLFVGLFEDAEYEEKSLRLSEGETLLFYSDAVVDALRYRAGLVESAGLLSLVAEHQHDDAAALVDAISAQVLHQSPQHQDDTVLLALRCEHVEEWHAVVVPSDFHESTRISTTVLEHLTRAGFGDRAIFAAKLALEEALANAIKHGNKGDPAKRVHVRYSVCPERFVVLIRDEGTGFNPEAVPDPTAEDRLGEPTGRGIMLMRHYMTSVEYNTIGNEVRMTLVNA